MAPVNTVRLQGPCMQADAERQRAGGRGRLRTAAGLPERALEGAASPSLPRKAADTRSGRAQAGLRRARGLKSDAPFFPEQHLGKSFLRRLMFLPNFERELALLCICMDLTTHMK